MKRVLEIGVGVGSDSRQVLRPDAGATGVDFAEQVIELVRQRAARERAPLGCRGQTLRTRRWRDLLPDVSCVFHGDS